MAKQKVDKKMMAELREMVSEDTQYFEQYKNHFMYLFGDDQMPDEVVAWQEKYEDCLKVLWQEEIRERNNEVSFEQFCLSAYTIMDFKRYLKQLNGEVDSLLRT